MNEQYNEIITEINGENRRKKVGVYLYLAEKDSLQEAFTVQNKHPKDKVAIMIAGNAGRPFGGLGKQDYTGFEKLPSTYVKRKSKDNGSMRKPKKKTLYPTGSEHCII